MLWFSFAFFGYSCLAIVSILDKYILSEEKVKPIMFVFYSSVFISPLLLAFPFLSHFPILPEFLVAVSGALAFVFSLGTMYLAYTKSEVSHSGPFIGALIPLFILVLSQIFLKEVIGNSQIFGIFLLSFGTFLISIQKDRGSSNWRKGLLLAMLSAFLYSIFHVSAKYLYENLGFQSGFILLWGMVGFFGLALFLFPEVRNEIFPKRSILRIIFRKIFPPPDKPKKQIAIIATDKLLGVIGVVSIQYAVSIGSVAKVNSLSGAQYALLVIIVAFLSKFFPNIFKEDYGKGEVLREMIGVAFIAVGLVFLVR